MDTTEHTGEPWSIVGNSWQHKTIYDAASRPICRLDLEDWGVDEDNQIDLERLQTATAQRIALCINAMAGLSNEQVSALRASHAELLNVTRMVPRIQGVGFKCDLGLLDAAIRAARAALSRCEGVNP